MAKEVNFLSLKLRQGLVDPVGSGVDVSLVADSDGILGADFGVSYEALPFDYNSSTDTIRIVCSNGWGKTLTRVGDWFRWTVTPSDLSMFDVSPGTNTLKSCHIAFERTASGVRTSLKSKSFNVNVHKERRFSPLDISGCIGWFSPYDFGSTTQDASLTSWADKSLGGLDFNLIGAVAPTISKLPNDYPVLKLVTTPVRKLYTTVAHLKDPYTIFGIARYNGVSDGTFRKFITLGGTNGVRIGVDSINFIAKSGAGSTTLSRGTIANDYKAFAYMVQYDHTNLVLQLLDVTGGTGTTATSGVTNAVTAGTLIIGDDAADAQGEWQVGDIIIYNNASLSSDNKQQIIRSLCSLAGITP